MKLAFILDPLDALKAYKDSSIAMMRAAARRGHQVFAIQREALVWEGGEVSARALALTPTDDDHAWYRPGVEASLPLTAFDAVLMRQDPPFNLAYISATHLLDLVRRHHALGGVACQMVGHDVAQLVEPEQRHLRQQRPLARDRLTHDHIERTDAVRGHHQDAVAAHRIVVTHLAAGEKWEGG